MCNKFIMVHEWQVEFCGGKVAAAILLELFNRWHFYLIKKHGEDNKKKLLQYHTVVSIRKNIFNMYSDKTIRSAMKYLESKNIIEYHEKPNKDFWFDRKKYFLFCPQECNNWLIKKDYSPLTNKGSDIVETQGVAGEKEKVPDAFGKITETIINNNKENKNNNINKTSSVDNAKGKKQPAENETVGFSSDTVEKPTDENGKLVPKARKAVVNMITHFEKEGKVSSPKQLIQQVIFVLESKYYFPDKPFWHRFNICKKLIRTNKWTTPKGMQKHHHNLAFEATAEDTQKEQKKLLSTRHRRTNLVDESEPTPKAVTEEPIRYAPSLLDSLTEKLEAAQEEYQNTKENQDKLVFKLSQGNETKAKRFKVRIENAIHAKENEIKQLEFRINRLQLTG